MPEAYSNLKYVQTFKKMKSNAEKNNTEVTPAIAT